MTESPRIVIVGVGSIGARHIDNLLAMGYEDLVGVDTRPMPNDERLPIVTCFEDLGLWRPTHALICTPPDQHYHHARYFLESGIPTFIEKPMTMKAIEAVALNELAKAAGTYIGVGYMERANHTVQVAKEYAMLNRCVAVAIDCHWMCTDKTYTQDVILESSHALDTAQSLLGPVVKAHVLTRGKDHCFCQLTHRNGLETTVSMNMNAIPLRQIAILDRYGRERRWEYGTSCAEWRECYRAELQAFLNGKPLCTGADGVAVMEIIEQLAGDVSRLALGHTGSEGR